MLDTETKRRIDTARDILVGKVPDPKSQVEQITIALIYKFMDDMDAQAEELGGKRSFFAGEFEKYGWAKLMTIGLGGYEVINLYAEAIAKMPTNPGIPPLFRDIFKNAYLPYRDPETLKSFLKVINDFSYDHSERLGDAFEYLLSVLGSQGDAGQFRTPRHIIDFMVALIDPQKNESVLDPACGTAGFLISAYKHIMEANAQDGKPGGALSLDERARLANTIKGYDISPDMVRLSLVNLYLHGFTDPHIFEYDTLTSDERWNEHAEIIMANPPFMSPKGGIRPHNRFSVQSNRSEVLFVDYIAEHLSPQGRAAVIVPEGIIFQGGTAYKSLRKMLVENYLVGLISLPAGVFNPYSGVKTSILGMDKTLAKKSNQILFAKIESDGFDLGAQRREIKQNDLRDTLPFLRAYKSAVTGGALFDADAIPNVTLVDKARIAENGDYNLSGERYRKAEMSGSTKFPLVELGQLCTFEYGKALKEENRMGGEYPVFGSNGIVGYHNDFLVQAPFLVVGRKGSAGEVHYSEKNGYPIDTTFYIKLENENRITIKYLFHISKSLDLKSVNTQSGVPGLNRNDAYKIKIPLPPLAVQEQIVAEIDGYQQIIDGACQVVEHYQPRIEVDPAWKMVALGELLDFVGSGVTPFGGKDNYLSEGILFIRSQNVLWGECDFSDAVYISKETHQSMSRSQVYKNDVLLNITGASIGRSAIYDLDREANVNQHVTILRPKSQITPSFLMRCLLSKQLQEQIWAVQSGASRQALNYEQIKQLEIPLPDLATQERIVAQIEREQARVKSTRELIQMFEQKIKDRIAKVWGE